jgi:hypothetical protein
VNFGYDYSKANQLPLACDEVSESTTTIKLVKHNNNDNTKGKKKKSYRTNSNNAKGTEKK